MNAGRLRELSQQFVADLAESKAWRSRLEERRQRVRRAESDLASERIEQLSEADIREIFFDTQAFGFWRNKLAEFERRKAKVGLDGLRSTLEFLIRQAEDGLTPQDLIEIQRNTGVGLLLATELATYRFPDRCWVFSPTVTPAALNVLGFDLKGKAPYGHRSDAYLYAELEDPVRRLRIALEAVGIEPADNVLVDLFLRWIWETEQLGRQLASLKRNRDAAGQAPGGRSGTVRETPLRYQPAPVDVGAVLGDYLSSVGLSFSAWQVAAFYTGLQVKGFVILSGISGTGKTRLAQYFAEFLDSCGPPTIPTDRQRASSHRATTRRSPSKDAAPSEERAPNRLFVPVRPDWRDTKSLLGYYNPLSRTYEWTGLLKFLIQASDSFSRKDGRAWFVILDEMNLARVEHYFSDFLSVLESGRDSEGWTREPLRFNYPIDAGGELPPTELFLPSNLYVVGTVNTDETTHTFSAKVLDRAFALPLQEIDLGKRRSQRALLRMEAATGDRDGVLWQFTQGGTFRRIDESGSEGGVALDALFVERMQRLHDLLRPYNLHFGYRVYDEIAAFVDCARRNHLFESLGGENAALDAAVLMKVLPKFYGARSRLENPLVAILGWCVDPLEPGTEMIRRALRPLDTAPTSDAAAIIDSELEKLTYRFPVTAGRVRQILAILVSEGFFSY